VSSEPDRGRERPVPPDRLSEESLLGAYQPPVGTVEACARVKGRVFASAKAMPSRRLWFAGAGLAAAVAMSFVAWRMYWANSPADAGSHRTASRTWEDPFPELQSIDSGIARVEDRMHRLKHRGIWGEPRSASPYATTQETYEQ